MKIKLLTVVLLAAVMMSCSSAPKFSNVTGKEWKLVEARIDNKDILFDRNTLVKEEAGDIFTLNFSKDALSGKGAPNRYNAPYTVGKNQVISIKPLRSTLMAALWQPEKLPEHAFFAYMNNVYAWNLVNNRLELRSKTEDGKEVRLLFAL